MLGVPPPPEHSVIGNNYKEYFAIGYPWLHYSMSFKTIVGGFNGAFWWYGPLSEDREILKQIFQNYHVALRELLQSCS